MSLSQDDIVVSLDVPKAILDTYVRNCLTIKDNGFWMRFAGDQKVEPWNHDSKRIRRFIQGGKI
jgi:hypothetical protein